MPTSSHDFSKDILPGLLEPYRVIAYPFRDVQTKAQSYWRDVGTVDAFWEANMEMVGIDPELNLYDRNWPIWTYQDQAPPAKFVFDDEERRGMAVDSMVADGCIVSGGYVNHSLLFRRCRFIPTFTCATPWCCRKSILAATASLTEGDHRPGVASSHPAR